jgi:hypothetical protein
VLETPFDCRNSHCHQQTRSNYKDMKQVAATAGEFVVSCAVICSESTVGPSENLKRALNAFTKWVTAVASRNYIVLTRNLHRTLGSLAGECDKLSRLNLLSRYLQQSAHMGDLQDIRIRLKAAIHLFQVRYVLVVPKSFTNLELDRKFGQYKAGYRGTQPENW